MSAPEWPIVGDIVLALRRTLMPHEFIPKWRKRPARVTRVFVDEWGIPTVVAPWLPLSDGEEAVGKSLNEERHAIDTISVADPVTALAVLE